MAFRPVLRAGLALQADEGGEVRVVDAPSGVVVRVPAAVAPLLATLDGHLDAEQALTVSGVPREEGLLALRSLAMTGCLLGADEEGRRARVEARAAGARHAAQAPFRFASHTRFECGACGACCTGDAVDAPLTQEEMDRIAAADLVRHLPPGPLFVRRPAPVEGDPAAREAWFLARDERGACVLLDPAGRCRVHAELGAAGKPLGCQLFPFAVRPTPDGVVVSDSTRCATFTGSSAAGPPVYERFEALRPVLRAAAQRLPLAAGAVRLAGGVAVTEGHARLALGRAIEAMDAREGSWLEGAGAALGALAAHEALVLAEPPGPGMPGRVIDRLWAEPLEVLAAAPDPPPVAPDAVEAALHRLLGALREAPGDDDLVRRALARAPGEAVVRDAALDAALRRGLRQRLHGAPLEAAGALAPCAAAAVVTTLVCALAAQDAGGGARPLDAVQPRVVRALRTFLPDGLDAATLVRGGVLLPRLLGRTCGSGGGPQ